MKPRRESTTVRSTPSAPGAGVPPAFHALLEVLRRRGFRIGVDHYLRLARLLEKSCAPDELRHRLGPIFATDEPQQRLFQRLFDQLYPYLTEAPEAGQEPRPEPEPEAPITLPPPRPRRWPYVAGALLLLFLLFSLAVPLSLRRSPPAPPQAAPTPREAPATPAPLAAAETPSPELRQRALTTSTRWTMIALPLILWAAYELYRHRRSRLALRRAERLTPPFVWPLRLDGPLRGPFETERLRATSRTLRRRQLAAARRLDLAASVRATVAAVGRIELRYRAVTRVPEYLMLIERRHPGDHRAAFADELARSLQAEDLFVRRLFFEGDPRHGLDEQERPVSLSDLRDRLGEHRLLLWTDGTELLDPLTGGIAPTAELLGSWRERALLTPRPVSEWDWREIQLAGSFVLAPATLDGLTAVAEHFEAASRPRPEPGAARAPDRAGPADAAQQAETLRAQLGESAFRWLCACAVHPELHWDLTLHLATLPSLGGDLLRERHVLALLQLPWFREGRLPAELRWQLILRLPAACESEVRGELRRLLTQDPPPPGSVASERRSIELALHGACLGDQRERRRWLGELGELPAGHWRRDLASLRLLETLRPSRLDLLLPRRWRSWVYRGGLPLLGLRSAVLLLLVVTLTAGLWAGLIGPGEPEPEGEPLRVVARTPSIPGPRLTLPQTPPPPTPGADELGGEGGEPVPAPAPSERGGTAPIETPVAPISAQDDPSSAERGAEEPDPALPSPGVPEAQFEPELVEPTDLPAAQPPVVRQEETDTPAAAVPEGLSLRVPWRPSVGPERLEVPVNHYQRPVDFTHAELWLRRTWFGRTRVVLIAHVANAGGPGWAATFFAELLDGEERTVEQGRERSFLSEGGQEIRLEWPLEDEQIRRIERVQLGFQIDYDPSPLRRLIDRVREEDEPGLEPVEPSWISTEAERTVLELPLEAGRRQLDLLVRPLDHRTVEVRRQGRRIVVQLVTANPSDYDERLRVHAFLLDADGAVLAEEVDHTVVEEGDRSQRVTVSWRLRKQQLEVSRSVRLVLTSERE